MKITEVSIQRPVFAAMIMVAVAVFGTVLYFRLPVDLFPDVDFPVVTVTVVYPGADPETMETRVAEPIEEAVNSLGGIRMLRSTNLESVTQVAIQFDLDQDLDVATQDVRDRVSSIQDQLPEGAELPRVEKLDLGAAPIMQLAISGTADARELSRFAEDVLKPGLERIGGVGQLELVGSREREIHVYVHPERLRAYGMTVGEVVQALQAQNLEVPGGRLDDGSRELTVRTSAEAQNVAELERITLSGAGGRIVRLGDVARVEDGLEERRSAAYVDGHNAIALVVRKQSGANTVAVAERVREALPGLQAQAPAGTEVEVLLDTSTNIEASIETVQLDLVLGAFLCVGIIFLFLRDIRATFISALTLPTTVIGTLGFVQAMGFSLNLMTTLALSLSIGILIDDAIVVVENIVRHRSKLGKGRMKAAFEGTSEIGLAVLATSAATCAVFVPVAFMEGMIGQFFYEFGLTVTFAIALSTFISLTMTPMLASRMLKSHGHGEGGEKGLGAVVEKLLGWLDDRYRGVVRWALRHSVITLALAFGALVGAFMLTPAIGFEFIPPEDRGQFTVTFEMPVGTSLEQTEDRVAVAAERIREVPGVESTFTTVGGGVQERVNTASMIVTLMPRQERAYHQTDVMAYLRRLFGGDGEMLVGVEELQEVQGGGESAPVQYNLRGNDLDELAQAANAVADRLRETEGFVDVDITYRSGRPELEVALDRRRADDVGVMGGSVGSTVRTLVAGTVATELDAGDDRHDVRVQLPPERRQDADAIRRAQVRSTTGALVDVDTVADVNESEGPSQIDRQARQRQITVTAQLEDKPLGDAMAEVEQVADEVVPAHITRDVGGMGQILEETVQNMALALFLAIVMIYVILASQFESLIHPLTIMVSLPLSLVGALGLLLLTGESMSIFAMIGFIMLMGLVTKNAILLVDYANQQRDAGLSRHDALVEAGATRLRPILMTTLAMIFGMLPVAIGHGDGGEVRRAMGIAVIGGLTTSTILTLVVIPVVYTLMDRIAGFAKRLVGGKKEEPASGELLTADAEE
ncbi:MAG TPA: efflux RND transporter permease subunit [Sandaracinaceae bacterium LLY-WYZ-13_1]|nr:efflux RND transporter permease subunit [Sandaracinaceae bacterium LLY-WYZ-13_1]